MTSWNFGKMFSHKFIGAAAVALALLSGPAFAAGGHPEKPKNPGFSFEGPFGKFDQAELQRGFKVYREVCASCHGMKLLSYRNLGQKGGPFYDPKYKNPNDNPIVKQIASEVEVPDIDPDTGDAITRPATTSDRFKSPFRNDETAKSMNSGALPPDLSVITKARKGGARYVYSILTGYVATPAGLKISETQHYNPYFPGDLSSSWTGDHHHVPKGGVLAMAAPLKPGTVSFDDGTESTVSNQAKAVASFLEWAGDPHAVARKQTGFAVILYLLLLLGVVYAAYRQVWKGKH